MHDYVARIRQAVEGARGEPVAAPRCSFALALLTERDLGQPIERGVVRITVLGRRQRRNLCIRSFSKRFQFNNLELDRLVGVRQRTREIAACERNFRAGAKTCGARRVVQALERTCGCGRAGSFMARQMMSRSVHFV